MTKHWLDNVIHGRVVCDDNDLIIQACSRERSCILTSRNLGLIEQIVGVINPHTYDSTRICGMPYHNVYVLSDMNENDKMVSNMIISCASRNLDQWYINDNRLIINQHRKNENASN